MGNIAARIVDAAETRAFECLLPDDVRVSAVAARLAELSEAPLVDPNGHTVAYALMVIGGTLLDGDTVLADHDLPEGIDLRLLPEVVAGADEANPSSEPETDACDPQSDAAAVQVREPVALLPEADSVGRPQIRIDVDVHRQIARFAERDRRTECAGLLLGDMGVEGGERVVHIRAALPAACAPGTRATVRITHQAWESMMQERDEHYEHLRVLGWFHTHAGWGVFMSELDVFIQRSYFNHPNLVAYVLDPTTGRDGFFVWQDGKISLAPTFSHVGEDAPPRERREPAPARRARRPDLRDAAIVVLAAVAVYLGVTRTPAVDTAPARPQPAAARPAPAAPPAVAEEPDRVYVIGSGDNPWTICQRVYGNGALAESLARYNGLDDVSGLQIGQQIKLPTKEKLLASAED